MDCHRIQTNRHKKKEEFKSGSAKQKIEKEKQKKTEEVIAKSRCMTDYMSSEPSCSAVPKNDEPQKFEFEQVTETLAEVSETLQVPSVSSAPVALSEDGCLGNDIGLWPEIMTQSNIDFCMKMDSTALQNCDSDLFDKSFKQSDRSAARAFTRKCQKSFFLRKTRNGEIIKRTWLCFSPSNGHVYCYVCKLFSQTRSQLTHGGYCDWKNASGRLVEHESSKNHLNAVIDFDRRSKEMGCINQELTQQANDTAKYWKEVLKRLISVIVFISERGLAFRGENEILGSPRNGNYLGLLELIAEYDDFLSNHLKNHGNCGRGHTNYLSSTICEEVVQLISKQVFNEIISRIKKSKYYSISLDSTPDEGHVDHVTLIFRYLEEDVPVERFVTFMPNQGHKAEDMFQGLNKFLKENEIDINNCRGQSYDNASSMSEKYNDLQALVLAENKLAVWVPCPGHSLSLVVQAAAECCLGAVSFFTFLEELFVYFTASTNRYKVLTDCLEKADPDKPILVPKRITTTHWSCRTDATKALLRGYREIKNALFEISQDKEDSGKSRITALSLHNKMSKLETGLYTVFWEDILGQVNKTSGLLENPRLDVNTATSALASLTSFIRTRRDSFEEYEVKAAELVGSDCTGYENETQRKRKINVRLSPLDCVQAPEVELTPSEKFRTQNFLAAIDQFESSLRQRIEAYKLIGTRFGFLNKLNTLSNEEIIAAAQNLAETYNNDLDDQLGNELIQFKSFYHNFEENDDENEKIISQERWMYKLILEKNVKSCFPNTEIALRMYLSLMVTNSSGERSFSKLKLIKNKLRTSMLEGRLNALALLSIESDILRQQNYEDIISSFISTKCRRKLIKH